MSASDIIKHPFRELQLDNDTLRYRLAMQGFTNVSESELNDVQRWLRFSPAVCMVGVAIGTIFTSSLLIGVLIPIAAVGIVYHYTLFDLLYNHGIRKWTATAPLPPRRAPSRFACLVAAVWLSLILWAFLSDNLVVGYVLGAAMVIVAGLMTFMHYCVASHIYRLIFGWGSDRPA